MLSAVVRCPSEIDHDPEVLQSLDNIIRNFAKIEIDECTVYYHKNDSKTVAQKLNDIRLNI
jgi:vacuolar-type H+-ATPase subunit E/Vma4